jgi:hypothetical protein
MASGQPVTCQIRYTLNLAQLEAFEAYARAWMSLIERYGGVHHGYPLSFEKSFQTPRLKMLRVSSHCVFRRSF